MVSRRPVDLQLPAGGFLHTLLLIESTMIGTVKAVRADKGFCFVRPEGSSDNQGDHFLHVYDCQGFVLEDVKVGTLVEFESTTEPRGLRAKQAKLKG